ncbi:1,4-dihydroxy-6-naphthoate synthase [Ammoniphilus sp. YIM 78166]|uniref:1,4-dihydroxy-6-naphthoate synthase n=1 Tax=Ammoniphilus sp. YIM 78166 TaxID=1644106 RepID=UPI001070580E|nr:1,4-dihydroxy-6-naphthoate synthase [Ammoniphilus sp. YIM 78166]
MNIAFSPCPNDTFVFHAWVHNLINGAPAPSVTYADIDKTNHWAVAAKGPEILKVSYAALPWALKEYTLLPCGGALGRGCGPLVLTNDAPFASLEGKRVAVPSEMSTAYLLFRLWAAQNAPRGVGEIIILPFHEIMPAVRDGKVDAGLVIHEARFTYPSYGLKLIADLGDWWEKETNLPIPLGAIIARRNIDTFSLVHWIRASVEYAWANPDASKDYILHHAQEMSEEVVRAHIQLYVNEFTANLGEEGYEAVITLLDRAAQEELVPRINLRELRL